MPLILAIDTTHEFGSLALARRHLSKKWSMHAPTGFAHVLYGHLSALLERHGVPTATSIASPPPRGRVPSPVCGSAWPAVKGLAEAAGKPAMGVSNLQALAMFRPAPLRAVVIDARRGEIYGAVYDGRLRPVTGEVVTKLPLWLNSLPQGDVLFVSTDFTSFADSLSGRPSGDRPGRTRSRDRQTGGGALSLGGTW